MSPSPSTTRKNCTQRSISTRICSSTNKASAADPGTELHEIPGVVPNLRDPIPGCAFADRCEMALDRCRAEYPPLSEKRAGHFAACWRADELLHETEEGR